MNPAAVLLDTCAVIWLANGDRLRQQALFFLFVVQDRQPLVNPPVDADLVLLLR